MLEGFHLGQAGEGPEPSTPPCSGDGGRKLCPAPCLSEARASKDPAIVVAEATGSANSGTATEISWSLHLPAPPPPAPPPPRPGSSKRLPSLFQMQGSAGAVPVQTRRQDLGLRREWFFFTFSGPRRKRRGSSPPSQRRERRPTSATRLSWGGRETPPPLLTSCLGRHELVLGIAAKTEGLDITIIRV